MNQVLTDVSTCKAARSVRLPDGDVPAPVGSGLFENEPLRHFIAL
jgi:hypothetical protein